MADVADTQKHVLVVNDTEEIIELFREIIEGMGHRMTATTFSPDDLAAVTRIAPDLAILDLMVGGDEPGWQLVQKMKMSPETQDIPIIVCSGAAREVREQEGWLMSKGVKLVLKPFEVSDMEEAITKALALGQVVEAAPGDKDAPTEHD